jgi:hypothetical protein
LSHILLCKNSSNGPFFMHLHLFFTSVIHESFTLIYTVNFYALRISPFACQSCCGIFLYILCCNLTEIPGQHVQLLHGFKGGNLFLCYKSKIYTVPSCNEREVLLLSGWLSNTLHFNVVTPFYQTITDRNLSRFHCTCIFTGVVTCISNFLLYKLLMLLML